MPTITYSQQDEIKRLRAWTEAAERRITAAATDTYLRFSENQPADAVEMAACLELSVQLSDARKLVAELTLVRAI